MLRQLSNPFGTSYVCFRFVCWNTSQFKVVCLFVCWEKCGIVWWFLSKAHSVNKPKAMIFSYKQDNFLHTGNVSSCKQPNWNETSENIVTKTRLEPEWGSLRSANSSILSHFYSFDNCRLLNIIEKFVGLGVGSEFGIFKNNTFGIKMAHRTLHFMHLPIYVIQIPHV